MFDAIIVKTGTNPLPRVKTGDGKWLKHVCCEGSREHVISWDTYGQRCSEPDCIVNKNRQEMTKEQKALKVKIEKAEAKVAEAENVLRRLAHSCKHYFRPLTQAEQADKWMSEGAKCEICGANFGWRCKRSPDSICHYHSDEANGNRVVTLLDGTEVPLPVDHDPKYETCDQCLFCGHPEERK